MKLGRRRARSARSRRGYAWCALLAGLAVVSQSHALNNAGFESGADGLAAWTSPSGAADVHSIVLPGDDCAAFIAYANVDCGSNNVIEVITGQRMVRLGTPKGSPESQDQTPVVLQSDFFTPLSDSLTLAARLFTYEFRGDDQFIVEVVDQNGAFVSGVTIGLDFGPTGSCSGANPCVIDLDIGGRSNKAPFDSGTLATAFNGAQDIVIAGLPLDTAVSIRYTLNPSNNEAHPSWVYLDNRNSPPNAVIEFGPGDPTLTSAGVPAAAIEGDFVSANCSASTDPENDDLTCNWKAWGGGLDATEANPLVQLDTTVATFYFPDSTTSANCDPVNSDCTAYPTIELEVSDGQAPPVTSVAKVNLLNAQPIVGAVDMEVLPGTTGRTVCRFADAGIGEYGLGDGIEGDGTLLTSPELGASVSCDPSGDSCVSDAAMGALTVYEKKVEHVAEFSSGYVLGALSVAESESPGTATYDCTITDKDGASGSAPFDVTIVSNVQVDEREPAGGNDSIAQTDALQEACASDATSCVCPIGSACAASGAAYLARLESTADQDVYVLRNPDGTRFRPNSDVLVTLEVPADYELLILARLADGEVSAPFFGSPRITAPFFGSAFSLTNAPFFGSAFSLNQAPFFNSTFQTAPFFGSAFSRTSPVAAPFFNSTFQTAPFFNSTFSPVASPYYNGASTTSPFDDQRLSFDRLPLSKTGLALPDGDGISAKDIDGTDTGSLSLQEVQAEPNLQIVDFSAAPGDGTEAILFKTTGNVVEYYAVVYSSYGAFASAPYSLRVESSEPPLQEVLWANSGYCDADTTFMPGGAYPAGTFANDDHTSAEILVISQKERFETVHPEADFETLVNSIRNNLPGKNVAVVSVPAALYADADFYPCRVEERNALAEEIKGTFIVDSAGEFYSENLEAVVVLGDNSVVPSYARLDTTLVGNESDYGSQAQTVPGSWTTTAIAEGYNTTYAFYADKQGLDFEGDKLWIEDVPVTVLVGDSATLQQEIASTSSSSGRAAITGYEAFADSAQINADLLNLPTNSADVLIDFDGALNPWTAAQLQAIYDDGTSCTAPLGLVNLQAHMTPQLLLSSAGFSQSNYADIVTALEPKNCLNAGTATLSLGCHSGLELPKLQVPPTAPGQSEDPTRYQDWVDEIGAMIAPTGYGLGDRVLAGRVTEGLLTRTLQAATDPSLNLTLPQALVKAKQDYLLQIADFDAHDADALMVLTAFMMPNFTLDLTAGTSMLAAMEQSTLAAGTCSTLPSGGSLEVTYYQNGILSLMETLDYSCEAPGDLGEYNLLSDGGASGAYNRPLLPLTRGVEAQPIAPGMPFNDVLLVNREPPVPGCPDGLGGLTRSCRIAATFEDTFNVDPVFSFPETNWSQPADDLENIFAQQELDTCVPNLAPFPLSYFTTVGDLQTQQVRSAQFVCDEALSTQEPGGVRGTQRRFSSLYLDALQANVESSISDPNPDAVDQNPPQTTVLEFFADKQTNEVVARIAATDAFTGNSGVGEITVLVFHENIDGAGGGIVESYSTRYDTMPTYNTGAAIPDGQVVEFTLPQARGARLASQICDRDGNCVFKTLKGGLLVALDVTVISLLVVDDQLQVLVENFEQLEFPTLTLEVCPEGGSCQTYLYDLSQNNPEVQISPANAEGITTITVTGLTQPGDTVTATIRSGTAFGSDTATLVACVDAIGDTGGLPNGDIARCGIRAEGDGVAFDLLLVDDSDPEYNGTGGVLDEDFKYRLDLINLSGQVQYFQGTNPDQKNNGKISGGPPGWKDVRAIFDGTDVRGLSFVFSRRDLENLGWTGGPIQIRFEIQAGVPGAPSQGNVDETAIYETPPGLF